MNQKRYFEPTTDTPDEPEEPIRNIKVKQSDIWMRHLTVLESMYNKKR